MRNQRAGVEEPSVRIGLLPLSAQLGRKHRRAEHGVLREKQPVDETHVDELFDVCRSGLPRNSRIRFQAAIDVVHAEGVSTPGQAREVADVTAVVAVPQADPGRTDSLGSEDFGLLFPAAQPRMSMCRDADARGPAGARGGAQGSFFGRGHDIIRRRHLDDSGLDARAVDALLDFADEELGERLGRPLDQGWRSKQVLPGAGHDLYSGLVRDLLDETDVAPHIVGSEIDEGIDPRRLECFQLLDSARGQTFPAAGGFWPLLPEPRRTVANVFMAQREAEFRHVDRAAHGLNHPGIDGDVRRGAHCRHLEEKLTPTRAHVGPYHCR
jgi:hypothetical protein